MQHGSCDGANVSLGVNSEVRRRNRDFRSSLKNRHRLAGLAGPKSNRRHTGKKRLSSYVNWVHIWQRHDRNIS